MQYRIILSNFSLMRRCIWWKFYPTEPCKILHDFPILFVRDYELDRLDHFLAYKYYDLRRKNNTFKLDIFRLTERACM
jgi:hypothetical protein